MDPGTSINFDGKALEEQEEAEFEREEKQREQELRELLSTALPDDLLEDDTISLSSHDSSLVSAVSAVSGKSSSSQNTTSDGQWQQQQSQQKGWQDQHQQQVASHNGSLQQQTSTPISGNSPPPLLDTPASIPLQNGYTDKHYERNGYQNGDVHEHNGYSNGFNHDYQYTNGSNGHYENHNYNQPPPPPPPPQQMNGYSETNGWNGHNGYHDGEMRFEHVEGAPRDGQLNGHSEYQHPGDNNGHPEYQHQGDSNGDVYNGYYNEHNGYAPQYENGVDYHRMDDGQYSNGYMEQQNGTEYINYSGSNDDQSNCTHEQNGYHYDDYEVKGHHNHQENMTNGYHNPNEGFRPTISPKHRSSMPELNKVHEEIENYKVQYRAQVMNGHMENGTGINGERFTPQNKVIIQEQQKMDDFERLQKEFLTAGGLGENRQLAQIQILYKARGRKLEELTNEIEIVKEEKSREIRIINHKLAVSEGERQGMANSLQQVQQLLQNTKQDNVNLQGKLSAAEAQIQSLSTAKTEIMSKLQMADATIENLNHQLIQLGKSESLTRARDQHDAVVSSMQRKFEYDLCEIREKLDQTKADCDQQIEENSMLRKQLAEAVRMSERIQIDHTETINKLTRNLEDSQKQCRELLETGSVQEISQLKIQLQQSNTARNISEGMYQALQDELSDLKEQLQLYESATQLGLYSNNGMEDGLSDSFTQLGIKPKTDTNGDWKTPKLHRINSCEDISSDDLVNGLKTELERSLSMIRSKRGHVNRLQNELKTIKAENEEHKNKADKAEKLAKDYEVKMKALDKEVELLKPTSGVLTEKEKEFKKETERLTQQYQQLNKEHEELQHRYQELTVNEEKMNELNCELKKEMAQMISEYDEDKRIALEKCQNACLQLQEDSSHRLRLDLQNQLEQDKLTLQEAHQQQLNQLQCELNGAMKEVDDVKQLYINICEEKTRLENTLRDNLASEHQEQLNQVEEELEKEKDKAIEQLRQELSETYKVELKLAEETWQKKQENDVKRQLETKIAVSKLEWLQEHNELRQQAVDNAVSAAERDWKLKMETTIEEDIQKRLQLLKENGKNGIDAEKLKNALTTEREKLRETYEEDKKKAIETSVALAEVEWMTKHQANGSQQLDEALKAAKDSWIAENKKEMVGKIEEAVREAREKWVIESEEETAKKLEDAVREADDRCKREQQEMLKRKMEEAKKVWVAEQETEKDTKSDEESQLIEEDIRSKVAAAVSDAKDQWKKNNEQVMKLRIDEAVRRAKNEWRMQGVEDMSTKIKEALREARERWHMQSKAEMTAKIEEAVKKARLEWIGGSSSPRHSLEDNRNLKKEISVAVESAKGDWQRDHHDEVIKAVSEAKASVWQEVKSKSTDNSQRAIADLQQEIRRLKDEQEEKMKKKVSEMKEKLQEQRTLTEEKDKEKKEALKRMQDKCDAEYSVFLEEHKETLKKTIKRSRHEFDREKTELLQQKEKEIKAIVSEKEKRWKGDYSSFLEKHRNILDETLVSARKEWEKETQELKKKHKADIQAMQIEFEEKKITMERSYGDKMVALKEELNKDFEVEVKKACEDIMDKKEQLWQEERHELLKQLQETEQELRGVEKHLKSELDDLRCKFDAEESLSHSMEAYEKERSELKHRLDKAQGELESADTNLTVELDKLHSKLEKEQKTVVRRMESKLVEQERKHKQTVDALTQQLLKAKMVVDKLEEDERQRHNNSNMSTQTDVDDILEIHGDGLQELREHYIAAVNKIRNDVLLYINESRERCAETVRSEVVKERHCTAKKLRKYYLQCLHQLLEEEKNGDKEFDHITASQKLALMAKTLEVTPECIVNKRRQASKTKSTSGRSSASDKSRSSRSNSSNNSSKSQHSTGSSKGSNTSSSSSSNSSKTTVRRRNLSDEFFQVDDKVKHSSRSSSNSDRYSNPSSDDNSSKGSSKYSGSTLKSVNNYDTPLSSRIYDSYSRKEDNIKESSDAHSNKENIQYSPLTKPQIVVTDKPYDSSQENSVSSLLQKYKVDPVTGKISVNDTPPQKLDDRHLRSRYDEVMSLPREPKEFNPIPERLTPDSKDSSPDYPRSASPANITLRPRSSSRSTDMPVRPRSRPSSPARETYRSSRSRERLTTPLRSSSSDAYLNMNSRSRNRDSSYNHVSTRSQSRDTSPARSSSNTHRYSTSQMATPVQSNRGRNLVTETNRQTSEDLGRSSSHYLIRPIRDHNGPPDGQSSISKQPIKESSYSEQISNDTSKMQKPIPMVTRQTQAPSPAPTNLSFVSLDTYNDLPAHLESTVSTAYKALSERSGGASDHQTSSRHARISPPGPMTRTPGIQSLPSRPQISTHSKPEHRLSDSSSNNTKAYSSFHPVNPSNTH